MQISDVTHIKTGRIPPEYTVYAYDKYRPDMIGYNKWQYLLSSKNPSEVLEKAEKLFESDKFQKIEIKKKFFDKKMGRYVVSTFRVFDRKSNKTKFYITVAIFIIAALLSGLFVLEVL